MSVPIDCFKRMSVPWTPLFKNKIDDFQGVVSNLETAEEVIRLYEVTTTSTFRVFRRNKGFTAPDYLYHKIQWQDSQHVNGPAIPFTGIPFIILGWEVQECQHGPDRNKKQKMVYKTKKRSISNQDHSYVIKTRKIIQNTKKVSCPASIFMRRIRTFPAYKINGVVSNWKRKQKSKSLRAALASGLDIESVDEIHMSLPLVSSHQNHLTGEFAAFCQPVDNKLKTKIKELVSDGVSKVSEMKRHLNIYVKKELSFQETVSDTRRYHPTNKDIKNHMEHASNLSRYSREDQLNLQHLVNEWKKSCPEDNFFLRICSDTHQREPSSESFVFVHQTKWQKRLLELYGSEICLLDATYKTSRFDLPLFFVCVHTNVGFSVVGSFIVANENKESIMEGLQFLSEWNPKWHPEYFMTDYDVREISAVEETFPGTFVYLCQFHREQAWERWLRSQKNGCGYAKEELLTSFRSIANSATEEDYEKNVKVLQDMDVWKAKKNLQVWFQSKWLSQSKRWVYTYRSDIHRARITTTNGLERQHLELKKCYLADCSDKSLSCMISNLVNKFLPDSYRRYKDLNVRSLEGYRAYSREIPHFLRNRPRMLVDHCLGRMPPRVKAIPLENIVQEDVSTFMLKSVDSGTMYQVYLGEPLPHCSCADWKKNILPCKHMLGIFQHFPACDWDFLPNSYRECPQFCLDPDILQISGIHYQQHRDVTIHNRNEHECKKVPGSNENVIKPPSAVDVTRKDCLEILKGIDSSIYTLTEVTHLLNLKKQLASVALTLQDYTELSDGLPLLPSPLPCRRKKKVKRKGQRCDDSQKHMKKYEEDVMGDVTASKTRKIDSDCVEIAHGEGNYTSPSNSAEVDAMEEFLTEEYGKDVMGDVTASKTRKIDSDCVEIAHGEGNYNSSSNSTEVDAMEVANKLKTIWNQRHDTGYILGNVYGTNITDVDIRSLKGTGWLTDQVIDGYLGALVQAERDQGKHFLRVVQSTMTSILKGECLNHMVLKHIIEPSKGKIVFYNPMGESEHQRKTILKNWRNFFNKRLQLGLEQTATNVKWAIETREHSKQNDSYNCGVFTLMFAERHIRKISLTNITTSDLQLSRTRIAQTLLMYEVYLEDCCPCCGYSLRENDLFVTCTSCTRVFHKKPHCVGEVVTNSDDTTFECKQCRIKKKQQKKIGTIRKQLKLRKPSVTKHKQVDSTSNKSVDMEISDWLYDAVGAKTTADRAIVNLVCGISDIYAMHKIKKGETFVGNEQLSSLFEDNIKMAVMKVIETEEGNTKYYQPNWRHLRWISKIGLNRAAEMRKNGIEKRMEIFNVKVIKELSALLLESFGVIKIRDTLRIGYGPGSYLTIKTENKKLKARLEDEMGQNLNYGINYFRDILVPEAEIMIAAHLWNVTLMEADKMLYPLPEKYVQWLDL